MVIKSNEIEFKYAEMTQRNNWMFYKEKKIYKSIIYYFEGYLRRPKIKKRQNINYYLYIYIFFTHKWAFCRYLWEAHPLLPEISLELLEQWEIQYNLNRNFKIV